MVGKEPGETKPDRMSAFLRFMSWLARHRPAVAAGAAILWTLVMLIFVDAVWIAAVCGIAFGIVLARSLPEPPD